jgi:hypothetical protein
MSFEKNMLIHQVLLESKSPENIPKSPENNMMRAQMGKIPSPDSRGTIRQGSAGYV